MDKSDKLYRFRSKSQHMLVVSVLGRRMKIKFSTPYQGLARYSTSNEVIARQIRQSQAFKGGLIVEDESVVRKVTANSAAKPKQVKTPAETPAWLKRSVKTVSKPAGSPSNKPADAPCKNQKIKDETKRNEVPEEKEPEGAKTVEGKVVQDEMFQMTPEDVDNYMDAKAYVRDVLHADVNRKEEVKAYCQEHGIVFPNFTFE